jgi:ubiquinone/menaquinone biosynthesis C-methylase UbiE
LSPTNDIGGPTGSRMSPVERVYPESRFGGFSDVDGTMLFYSRVHALLGPDVTVLDVGCGRGAGLLNDPVPFRRDLRNLRGKCRSIVGIDVDPDAAQNPGIDEFRLLADEAIWPVADQSIDLIISDFVLEHIKDPTSYFAEAARVLKPKGIFCARTSNRIGYVALLAKLIPQRRHAQILQKVQRDRNAIDVFPTQYRANTVWKIQRLLKQAGLKGIVYGYEAEPSYLQFSTALYLFGRYLHAVMPPLLRTSLFVFARKA